MKSNKTLLGFAPYILLIIIAAEALLLGFYGHKYACIISLGLVVAAAVTVVVYSYNKNRRTAAFLEQVSKQLSIGSLSASRVDIPIMAVKDGEISWYNAAFRKTIVMGHECLGSSPDFIVSNELIDGAYGDGINISYNGSNYRFYACTCDDNVTMCYFIDRSEAVMFKHKFEQGRPVVAYITIDNIDELLRGTRDSEGAQISGSIEKRIENWSAELKAICRKTGQDRFLLVTDEVGLKYMTDTRFDILDKVKAIDLGEKGKATLSIGIGHGGENFSVCEEYARQALDMALGRGGDQAAVKNAKDFSFFGGTASTVTKRSKVRTRMVASALSELIENCENVLIMGHRFADFDSFGSCYGLYRTIVNNGKNAKIVIQRSKCLCQPLVDYVCKSFPGERIIVSPEEARQLLSRQTLLIITDTHRASFLETPEIYNEAAAVAVIDHHRKTVDYINNAVIFYHEPYASSACEMVSELVQYMSTGIGRVEAEALMSGIMLDTRNFVLNTGVRTFEASAYLKSCGANTVTVKGLFQNSIEVYRERAAIVTRAEVTDECAISLTQETGEHVRIASSQAADDMLGIENVKASFVAFKTGDTVNISARSLGKINVQLIMEMLGGGGHLTMAACQLEGASMDDAMKKLKSAIKEYKHNNKM